MAGRPGRPSIDAFLILKPLPYNKCLRVRHKHPPQKRAINMQVWLGYARVFNLRIRMWHKVVSVIKLNNPFFCLNNKNSFFFEKHLKKMHNLKLKNSRQSMTNFLFGFVFQYNCRISTTPHERQTISQLAPVPPDTDGQLQLQRQTTRVRVRILCLLTDIDIISKL